MTEPKKTPGQPLSCPENNCSGCEYFTQCRSSMLANPENVVEAKKEAQRNSLGSLVFDDSGFDGG